MEPLPTKCRQLPFPYLEGKKLLPVLIYEFLYQENSLQKSLTADANNKITKRKTI